MIGQRRLAMLYGRSSISGVVIACSEDVRQILQMFFNQSGLNFGENTRQMALHTVDLALHS
jgi:hypothetical protein